MTIRKKSTLAPRPVETQGSKFSPLANAGRGLLVGAVLVGMTGCGMIQSVVGNDKVDYKGAKKAAPLDVPPDLTQLQQDNRYSLPGSKNGIATASGYNAQLSTSPIAEGSQVAPVGVAPAGSNITVERSGNQRWLVVKQTPEALWPQVEAFWEENGFPLVSDMPAAGIMETEWVENRAKIPQDIIRRTVGKVFDSLYASGERDKYRTRMERLPDGSTEIYISHRGAEEVLQGANKDTTTWTTRANDPVLEAQYLARLMSKLGAKDEATSKTAVDSAIVQPLHAKQGGSGADAYVEVDEGFDRAWRRVGLALDRVGFTVEDRDRTQGIYFVRYADPDAAKKADGFFKKLFSWGADSEKDKEAQRYRISVKAGTGNTSNVTVLTNEGQPDATPTSAKILGLLNEQLK